MYVCISYFYIAGYTFPETVTIRRTGPARNHFAVGEYTKTEGIVEGRPIWEQKKPGPEVPSSSLNFLFYTKNNNWLVGKDYHHAAGSFRTSQPGLLRIPSSGWEYFDGSKNQWILDHGLHVEGA